MKHSIIWLTLSILLLLSLILVSCTETTTSTTSSTALPSPGSTQTGAPPSSTGATTTNWWDKYGEPQYGGTLNFQAGSLSGVFDPWYGMGPILYWYEHLFQYDSALDRTKWEYKIGWAPTEYNIGQLLESWEWSDPQTMVGHVRQGVYWQDKAPANGRELTADDIQFHYDRILGTGSGFFNADPMLIGWAGPFQQVTATDKYTVVIKFKQQSFVNNFTVMDVSSLNVIECPDAVKLGSNGSGVPYSRPATSTTAAAPAGPPPPGPPGPPEEPTGPTEGIDDWKNACGTGAYILTDFLAGSSLTLNKNPNYWGYDERYPENRLPYADKISVLCIPDSSTSIAALRTGKIDLLGNVQWQQALNLEQTNPDLQQTTVPSPGRVINMKCDAEPFTDIKVRQAMQMSIDRQSIAKNYYGGVVDGKPAGLISPIFKDWCIPYDQWPADLKDQYSYNPAQAKQLLADAGYPNGFKTNVTSSSGDDQQLLVLIKSYFSDINVEMEIKVLDAVAYVPYIIGKKYDQMSTGTWMAFPRPPNISIDDLRSTQVMNSTDANDATYNAMADKVLTATDVAQAQQLVTELDQYVLKQNWGVVVCPLAGYVFWQPYLKGYSGETTGWVNDWLWPRLWSGK